MDSYLTSMVFFFFFLIEAPVIVALVRGLRGHQLNTIIMLVAGLFVGPLLVMMVGTALCHFLLFSEQAFMAIFQIIGSCMGLVFWIAAFAMSFKYKPNPRKRVL